MFKKASTYLFYGLVFMSLISFNACIKEYLSIKEIEIEDSWDFSLAVPIAHAKFSTLDLFNKANMGQYSELDEEYFVTLVYRGRPYYAYINDYLSLPDQHIQLGPYNYNTGGSDSIRVLNNIYFNENFDHAFTFSNGEEIVKMTLKKGKMALRLSSDIRRSGQLEITIPNAKKNNQPFMKVIPINYTGTKPVIVIDTFDLTGYTFDLTKGGTAHNVFEAIYTITLNVNTNYILSNDEANVDINFTGLEYAYIEGYFGKRNLNYSPDSLSLNIFNSSTSGIVSFVNPKIMIDVDNSIGLPVRVAPPYFESISNEYGNIKLTGPLVANAKDFAYPLLSEVGKSKLSHFEADGYNSNIRDMVNSMPKFISYDLNLESNPDAVVYTNFATDSSRVKVNVTMEIPLHAKSKEWETSKDFDFGGFDVDSIDLIKQVTINLIVTNELPLEVRCQLYFIDSTGAAIDSLFPARKYIIKAANTDAYSKLIAPTVVLSELVANNQRIQNIGASRKLGLHVWISSTDGGSRDVKVFADKNLDIKVSMKVDLLQDLNELLKSK